MAMFAQRARTRLHKYKSHIKGSSVWIYLRLVFGALFVIMLWIGSNTLTDEPPADHFLVAKEDVNGHHQNLGVLPPVDKSGRTRSALERKSGPQSFMATDREGAQAAVEPVSDNDRKTLALRQHKLRYDWTNLPVQSKIAKLMIDHQNNCSLPLGNYNWRKKIFGLGSDLHVWGAALCNGVEDGYRIRTHNINPWVWIDQEKCDTKASDESTMNCYFPHAELQCPQDRSQLDEIDFNISNPIHFKCNKTMTSPMHVYNKTDWRAAGIEMLFSHVAPIVQEEAERQLNIVFPDGVPHDLITVHMRWGDKKFENKVMKEDETISAIQLIRTQRGDNLDDGTSILLCTEDPKAVEAFKNKAPKHWKIYIDQFYYEMLPHRPEDEEMYNKVPKTSRALKGKTGLWSLGSLLVAMEANAFVLVLSSNWSRLMNELRKNVLDPRCNKCTFMIDVANGRFKEW